MRALARFNGGFLAERLILLLDRLLKIEVLVAALLRLVDDGLRLAVAAMAVDEECVAALACQHGGRLELFHSDFLLEP